MFRTNFKELGFKVGFPLVWGKNGPFSTQTQDDNFYKAQNLHFHSELKNGQFYPKQ